MCNSNDVCYWIPVSFLSSKYFIPLIITRAIVASIMSIVYRHILNHGSDKEWNMVPMTAVALFEAYIGIIITCTPHIAKLARTCGKGTTNIGSVMKFAFCCKCPRARPDKCNEASGGSLNTTSMPETPKQPQKLYPNLDISTMSGTTSQSRTGDVHVGFNGSFHYFSK